MSLSKKILIIAVCLVVAAGGAVGIAAGLGAFSGANPLEELRFESRTVTFDGTEHTLTVIDPLPGGAEVRYSGNTGTNAGTYRAEAVITHPDFGSVTLHAELIIEPAEFSGLSLPGQTVIYDGRPHSLTVEGELPPGTEVRYQNNGQTEGGEYTVTAVVTNPNYCPLTLTGTLNIRTVADAAAIIGALLDRPDPWSFLPEGLLPENMAEPLPSFDLSAGAAVSALPQKIIGRQLNVLYDALFYADTAFAAADLIFTAGETIAELYQTFLNDQPDQTADFTGSLTVGGVTFSLKITLEGDSRTLLAGNGTVSVELSSDGTSRSGRIQVTDGVVLRYEAGEDSLSLAVRLTVAGVGLMQQVSFVREDGAVTGSLHEFLGAESAALKTTALLSFNAERAVILSDKRESADLPVEAFEELYDARTGEYLGGEVAETVNLVDFETLWFPLGRISGLTEVRVTEGGSGSLNPHTVYLNGSAQPFAVCNIGGLGLDMLSRRFDVEMRTVWVITAGEDEEGQPVYEKTEIRLPMLFVQTKTAEDFSADVSGENPGLSLALPQFSELTLFFADLADAFAALKEAVTYQTVLAFLGENHEFFG